MSTDDIVIVAAKRTPIGAFQGQFSALAGHQLGSAAITACVQHSGIDEKLIDEAIIGCVLPAGQGQAPARQAALGAGLPLNTGCTTINKVCGSGMKAIMLAHDLLRAGSAEFHRRRRHGIDDQRTLSAAQGAFRLSHGSRPNTRSHVSGWPAKPL